MIRILFLISILFISFATSAQDYKTKENANKKAIKYFLKGRELSRANKIEDALKEFEKALKEEPTFIDAQLEWAGLKYYLKDEKATEQALEKVVALDPYYNAKILYTLGLIEQRNGKCDEAKVHLNQYLKAPKTQEVIEKKVKKLIADCDFQLDAEKNTIPFNPIRMGEQINTINREYFPSISADGETFFFTRVEKGQEDIFYANKKGEEWTEARPIPGVNTQENEANQSISADGKTIVFTACNRRNTGYGSCDLYISEFKNGEWQPARNMGRAINSGAWESQPSISADGRTLYFTSKRKDNLGKADIYISHRNDKGAWSVAQPIKGDINTPFEDQTPFIHPDGQTLYFKSKGHPGFGGFDIFYSKLQEDGTWGTPKNLGAPINSKYDEGSLVVSLDGKTAYFDSDRSITKEGAGKINPTLHDIYYFELDESIRPLPVTYVKARVIDAETKQALTAKVDFTNLSTQKTHAQSITDENGEFLVCLPVGKNYGLNVSKKDYLFHSENFALEEGDANSEPYVLIIELNQIPPAIAATPTTVKPNTTTAPIESKPIILKNIFFESGSAQLKETSDGELMKLYQLLKDTPKMKIQINGHTDNVGSENDNLTLSTNRAKAVYDYLIQKGISPSRLKYKGYGETQPITTNDTKEGKQLNRRTEFKVLDF